jgi:hypothetical protein
VGSNSNENSNSNRDSSDDKKSQGSDSVISGPKSVQDLNSLISAAKSLKEDTPSISCGFVNSNSNEDSSDEKIPQDIERTHSGPKPLPDKKPEVSGPAPPIPTVRPAEEHNLRKYKDFPVNEQIIDYMNETIIVIDHSFQNLFNNVRSVYGRSPSASIGRLLNIRIGSNPVTSAENYFNDPRRISLMCDYECAHKLTVIYDQVGSNMLNERPAKAAKKRRINTIKKIAKDILSYDHNGILKPGYHLPEVYQPSIPFVEVIEL